MIIGWWTGGRGKRSIPCFPDRKGTAAVCVRVCVSESETETEITNTGAAGKMKIVTQSMRA